MCICGVIVQFEYYEGDLADFSIAAKEPNLAAPSKNYSGHATPTTRSKRTLK